MPSSKNPSSPKLVELKDAKQLRVFKQAARQLGCDETEEGFNEALRKLARDIGQHDPNENLGKKKPAK